MTIDLENFVGQPNKNDATYRDAESVSSDEKRRFRLSVCLLDIGEPVSEREWRDVVHVKELAKAFGVVFVQNRDDHIRTRNIAIRCLGVPRSQPSGLDRRCEEK